MEKGDKVAAPALKSWLFRVASNESAGLAKQSFCRKDVSKAGESEITVPDPTNTVMRAETTAQVAEALRNFPNHGNKLSL